MKIHSFLTVIVITSAVALPACRHHEVAPAAPRIERQIVSGDPSTGNYVEAVTEHGANYSKTETITHSTAVKQVDPRTVKNPNATTRTVQETNVRKVQTPEGVKVQKSTTNSQSVTPHQ